MFEGEALVQAQGTFRNLDFESATVPPIPPGQFGSFEPIGDALPFWNAALGTNQLTQVNHNVLFVGAANVSILGPNWTLTMLIEGSYTALLQPGIGSQGVPVDASISQFGTIPASAQSLQFKSSSGSHHFLVSFGSENMAAIRLSATPTIATYGVDISSYAGLSDNLQITALYNNLDSGDAFLDSIVFSDQAIPEPSAIGLFGVCALFLGWRVVWRRKQTI
jgi:hypothetical protein